MLCFFLTKKLIGFGQLSSRAVQIRSQKWHTMPGSNMAAIFVRAIGGRVWQPIPPILAVVTVRRATEHITAPLRPCYYPGAVRQRESIS